MVANEAADDDDGFVEDNARCAGLLLDDADADEDDEAVSVDAIGMINEPS